MRLDTLMFSVEAVWPRIRNADDADAADPRGYGRELLVGPVDKDAFYEFDDGPRNTRILADFRGNDDGPQMTLIWADLHRCIKSCSWDG